MAPKKRTVTVELPETKNNKTKQELENEHVESESESDSSVYSESLDNSQEGGEEGEEGVGDEDIEDVEDIDNIDNIDGNDEEQEESEEEEDDDDKDNDDDKKSDDKKDEDEDEDDDCVYRPSRKKKQNIDDDDFTDDNDYIEDAEEFETIHVKDEDRITTTKLIKYERVRALGDRAKQIADGSATMLDSVGYTKEMLKKYNPIQVAELEIKHKVSPIKIQRTLPSGAIELFSINELDIVN
jgi:DNA-directed RNA polymerase subunit K/omega